MVKDGKELNFKIRYFFLKINLSKLKSAKENKSKVMDPRHKT